MNEDSLRRLGRSLSNWGRWGSDDQLGTLNLVTPEHVRRAAALVRRGRAIPLGIPVAADGPQDGTFRSNPLHLMTDLGSTHRNPGGMHYTDDVIVMGLQSTTQWDALAHIYYDDLFYNGFERDAVLSEHGAGRLAIDVAVDRMIGRGVLVDAAGHAGVPWLPAGHAIQPEDLDEILDAQGVVVEEGDFLLVRTGWRARFLSERTGWMAEEPGLGIRCAAWLHSRGVACVAADNWAVEAVPSDAGDLVAPLHMVLIRDLGMMLGELFDLEALAIDCAADGVYEFLFTAAPLAITGAVGSPMTPLAIK